MRWFRFVVLVLVATLLQASLLAYLGIKPDLLLVLLVFFAIYCDSSEAIISSFVIGFAADIIAPAMGPRIISFGLFGTALVYLNRVVAIKKMPYQAVVIFITGFLVGTLTYLLSLLTGEPAAEDIYSVLFWTSLYTALVGPFLFLPAAWWMRIKTKRYGMH